MKFIDTLFRLKLNHDVKFLGPRARQRIVEEKWNTLGTSRPFPDTITEHWEEAWHPEIDSETVVTDRDCIDYVTTTLLRSFLDGKAILELTAGTGDGFKVPPRPTQYNFKEMSDHMMVMTKQFSPFIDQYKRTVRNGSTPPRKKSPRKNLPRSNNKITKTKKRKGEAESLDDVAGRVDHVGDKDVIDESEESFANQKGNQNLGDDDLEQRAFDEDDGAQQDLSTNNVKEVSPRDEQQSSTVEESDKEDNWQKDSLTMDDNGDKANGGKSDDPKLSEENSEDEQTFSGKVDQGKESPENCKETGAENEPANKTNRSRASARMKVRAKVHRSWASMKQMDIQARDRFKPINYGKKLKKDLMVEESDKEEDNRKPAAKKRLQDNNDLFEGTTTRAKKMRLENHANESEVCETEDFQKSTEKKIKKKRNTGGQEVQKPGRNKIGGIFTKNKDDLLQRNIRRGLTSEGRVPIACDGKDMDMKTMAEMESFVQHCFKDWKWHTKEQHKAFITKMERLRDEAITASTRNYYDYLIKESIKERGYARRLFENEFKFSRLANIVGMKYKPSTKTYLVRATTKKGRTMPADDDSLEDQEDEVGNTTEFEVETEWVEKYYEKSFIEEVREKTSRDKEGYIKTPGEVKVAYQDVTVTKIKYVRGQRRKVADYYAIMKKDEEEKRKAKEDTNTSRMIRDLETHENNKKLNGPKPMKIITTKAQWLGLTEGNKRITLTEEWVRESFGDEFADALMRSVRGFADVPVGDYRESHLARNGHLVVAGAPKVKYHQSEGMHLCVPNALASVLYVLGFDGEAEEIHGYGVANMQNHPVVDALHQIHEKARMVLPNWIQISKYKCTKQKGAVGLENVEQGTILLAVLASSDDHKAHAVAIHDGFIYDANEAVALPYNQQALDYCTSTATKESKFVYFCRGLLFRYTGQKQAYKIKMTRRWIER